MKAKSSDRRKALTTPTLIEEVRAIDRVDP
jgi:hypothetical protein